jgi:hypothetical protein
VCIEERRHVEDQASCSRDDSHGELDLPCCRLRSHMAAAAGSDGLS